MIRQYEWHISIKERQLEGKFSGLVVCWDEFLTRLETTEVGQKLHDSQFILFFPPPKKKLCEHTEIAASVFSH